MACCKILSTYNNIPVCSKLKLNLRAMYSIVLQQQREGDDDEENRDRGERDGEAGEEQPEAPEEKRIEVEIPRINPDLGRQVQFVKMPNFLSVETRPFDPKYYEDEIIEDEVMDEEGRTRLKLKVSKLQL